MSLYDDVVITETGFTAPGANESSNGTSTTNKTNESSSDIAGWNNSLKLLQHQVEAAKKRQQSTLNALVSQKREKQQTIAPVIDLTEKKKPQLQLRKEPEFISNRNSYSEIRFNALTGKVEKEEVGSIFGTLNEEYDPMRPNDYEKLTFELRRLKQAQEEDARRAEREKRRKREEEEREKRRERERERRRRRRRSSGGSRSRSRSRSGSRSSGEDRSSKHRRQDSDEQKKKNSLFAPPPSLVTDVEASSSRDPSDDAATPRPTKSLFGGLMKVEKMMVKMGYKEGEGLGKNNQGMSMALLVEKTGARSGRIIHEKDLPEIPFSMVPSPLHPSLAPPLAPPLPPPPPVAAPAPASTSGASKEAVGVPSDVMKNMSKCVLLRNMVGPGDVDDELETETKEECQKYGEVNKVIIFEMPDKPPDEAVRIFIEFKTLPSAIKALTDLNGRFFGGRAVRASFYDLDKFQRLQLQEPV